MKLHKGLCFIVLSSSLFCPVDSFSAISFINGKWETTFDYSANCYHAFTGQGPSCVGIANDGIDWDYSGKENDPGQYTIVTTAANNPLGPGRGGRFWVGSGSNYISDKATVDFSTVQPELWIRWYMRFEQGFAWSYINYDKFLYIRTNGSYPVIPGLSDGSFYVYSGAASNQLSTLTWNTHMGGATSNGQWLCIEVYLKMDTDSSNGILRQWIDGVLVQNRANVDFSGGSSTDRQGWRWFDFHNNQSSPTGGPYYVDYDDMVIYNTRPPSVDAGGNPFIGPIGWEHPPDPPPPTVKAPTGLHLVQ